MKLRKVNLIINPAGTVMVEVQKVFRGKLLGKFGLVRNPLVPARSSPHSPVNQNTSDWPHNKKGGLDCQYCLSLCSALFHNWLKERALQGRIQDFSSAYTNLTRFY